MDIAFFAVTIVILAVIAWRLWKPKGAQETGNQEIMKLSERIDTTNQIWAQQFKELRDGIQREISESRKEQTASRDSSSKDLFTQMEKFTGRFGEMKTELESINKEIKEVSSFQTLFKSPKLTGEWGEASLKYLLSQYFPYEDLYESQHQFSSGEQVDFVLKLPNGRLLPIDSKYPTELFRQLLTASDDKEKDAAKKSLVAKVKKDIDDIATKYILPNENTTDFAIMYIPAESLYYEIISKEDISTYAWSKKVTVASPNNFILTIAIISHWFKDADVGKKTDVILRKLQRIAIDGEKLADTFRKLGDHLTNAKSSYDDSEKRIGCLVDRVKDATSLIGDEKLDNKQIDNPKLLDEGEKLI